MPAYLIVQSTTTNQAQMQQYRETVIPQIAQHGGKFIVRGSKIESLEGSHDGRGLVIIEFPSMNALRAFWDAPDYVPVKRLREGAAEFQVWAGNGV